LNSKDIVVKDKETHELRVGEELFEIEQTINLWKREINERIYSMGERFMRVKEGKLWQVAGYDSFIQWVADPEGLGMRPRTARMCMLLYRVWAKKLAKLGMTQENLIRTDYTKIAYVAKKILAETDPDKILELVHKAQTLTIRELQDEHEEEQYFTWYGTGKIHRALSERTGWVKTISQVKPRIQMSVQNFWEIFGNRICEIRIRYKKEE